MNWTKVYAFEADILAGETDKCQRVMKARKSHKGDRRRGEKCQEAEVQFHMVGQKEHFWEGLM